MNATNEPIYTVVGFSKGKTKADNKPFTKVALTFQPPYDSYHGYDVMQAFIYDDLDIDIGDNVNIVWGCRRDGKAYVQGLRRIA